RRRGDGVGLLHLPSQQRVLALRCRRVHAAAARWAVEDHPAVGLTPNDELHAHGAAWLTAASRKVGAATLLFWPLRPLWRLVLRAMPVRDAWERINHRVAAAKFGPGSTHDFAWYFEGTSSVAVSTLDDVKDWLLGCQYESDPELFQVEDFWQHPQTFEK